MPHVTAYAAAVLLAMIIPTQLGVDVNLRVVESFAKYVAPALGWQSTDAKAGAAAAG